MAVRLTPRMESWLRHLGAHIAVTRPGEPPTIVVVDKCICAGEEIFVELTPAQRQQIAGILAENDWVALGPGGLGAVRAPYQFKGHGRIEADTLVVKIDQIYCTKPGWEAGRRLDVMAWDEMCEFDRSRWSDVDPPSEQRHRDQEQ